MAKTRGPLMSIDAAGNYGKGAIQFRHGKRGVHAYRPTAPYKRGGQVSQAQLDHRNKYSAGRQAWQALNTQEKTTWNNLADQQANGLSGWNLFLKNWIETAPSSGPYVPPNGDAIHFIFYGTAYAPPSGNAIQFVFTD